MLASRQIMYISATFFVASGQDAFNVILVFAGGYVCLATGDHIQSGISERMLKPGVQMKMLSEHHLIGPFSN